MRLPRNPVLLLGELPQLFHGSVQIDLLCRQISLVLSILGQVSLMIFLSLRKRLTDVIELFLLLSNICLSMVILLLGFLSLLLTLLKFFSG